MRPIRRILCVIDPTTKEQPARERAAQVAKAFDADLHLLISSAEPTSGFDAGTLAISFERYKGDLLAAVTEQLEAMAKPLRDDGLDVSTSAAWHRSLANSVADHASEIDADLVMKDTHYHSAISRALFTNTDWSLIRHSPVPLWLVKATTRFDEPPRIVACVDPLQENAKPRELDDDIIDAAESVADALSGEVHLLHSYQPIIEVGNAAKWALSPEKLPVDQLSERIHARHSEAFERLRERRSYDEDRCHLVTGGIRQVLPGKLTELSASLAVLGAVSERNLKKMLIGTTAEAIMDHAPCDLLVVRR